MSLTFNMASGNYGDIPTPTEKTVSGAVVHITDALRRPAVALSTAINPVQSGSDYPSPTNIRPISGFSAANIVVSPTTTAGDGTTYTVSFGAAGTVYGGTLDVVNGTLTVTKSWKLLNDSTKWEASSGNLTFVYNENITRKLYSSSYTGLSCSYVRITSTASALKGRWQQASGEKFGIQDPGGVLTLADVQAAAVAGKIEICYDIEPIVYTLTPTEVQLLRGTNNVWSDTNGDTTLTYLADGRVNSLTALNMLLGGAYTPSADVSDREALQIIMGETT